MTLTRTIIPAIAALTLAACGSAENPRAPYGVSWGEDVRAAQAEEVIEAEPEVEPEPEPEVVEVDPQVEKAREQLAERIKAIGEDFGGSMGIAVLDVDAGWSTGYNETELFPQQSVSKTWVSLTALLLAEKGLLDLDAPVRVSREDLTLFHQPIRGEILRDGAVETTIGELIERAIQQSDNTANNAILQRVGGPRAVRRALANNGLEDIRFGPGEKPMQSAIAGLLWRDEYSYENNFFDARDRVPQESRKRAFENYLADPVDGATPLGIARALAAIERGEVLSEETAEKFLTIMSNTRSGPRRLKGGRPEGWVVSHKTGTGQFWNGQQSGYNDVGVLFAPDSSAYAVAVMIGVTRRPTIERMQMMQEVTRAVVAYHEALVAANVAEAEAAVEG
ncbi:serine hydrolase [Aurantiacibacter poecillastricola]|uniref:serine hydrolase n=1 Tax=Aurantiacibacter poecillastricola TaxID=3064385 RepID=UPI00273E4D52|nr:serine hydrolase [Aurantiacibacter sp. 219JJ12-13]MDP5262733.1 serine hydrolase [Aurantiacibacter sp. 219JJ12-13]